mmetsp:Transcript_14272/g.42749  ORF Transcript_14272/g.42749 Transcript_14272/m.42749 type:complete len:234 (-) Transcript_14272:4830-5531(-)
MRNEDVPRVKPAVEPKVNDRLVWARRGNVAQICNLALLRQRAVQVARVELGRRGEKLLRDLQGPRCIGLVTVLFVLGLDERGAALVEAAAGQEQVHFANDIRRRGQPLAGLVGQVAHPEVFGGVVAISESPAVPILIAPHSESVLTIRHSKLDERQDSVEEIHDGRRGEKLGLRRKERRLGDRAIRLVVGLVEVEDARLAERHLEDVVLDPVELELHAFNVAVLHGAHEANEL